MKYSIDIIKKEKVKKYVFELKYSIILAPLVGLLFILLTVFRFMEENIVIRAFFILFFTAFAIFGILYINLMYKRTKNIIFEIGANDDYIITAVNKKIESKNFKKSLDAIIILGERDKKVVIYELNNQKYYQLVD